MNIIEKVYDYLRRTGEPVKKLAEVNCIDSVCERVLGCLWDSLTPHEKGLMCGAMRGDWGVKSHEIEEREALLESWVVRWEGNHGICITIHSPSPRLFWGNHKVVVSPQIVRACKKANNLWPAANCKVKRLGVTLVDLARRCGVTE